MPEPTEKSADGDQLPAQAGPKLLKLPKIISFTSLAPCGEEVWIENNGQLYRLRRTSQGKLILTK